MLTKFFVNLLWRFSAGICNWTWIPFFSSKFYCSLKSKGIGIAAGFVEILGSESLTSNPALSITVKNIIGSTYISFIIGGLFSISFFLLLSAPVWFFNVNLVDLLMFLEHFKPNFLFKTSTSALNISEAGGERINVKLDIEKDLTEPIDKPIDKTSVKKKVNNWNFLYYAAIVGGTVGVIVFTGSVVDFNLNAMQSLIKAFLGKP